MQHLIEHGRLEQQRKFSDILLRNVAELGADQNAAAVLGKALDFCPQEVKVSLANTLCNVPGLLMRMAHTRHGHATVKLALELGEQPAAGRANAELLADLAVLRSTRYGRSVAATFEGNTNNNNSNTNTNNNTNDNNNDKKFATAATTTTNNNNNNNNNNGRSGGA
ncbi:unnamed protein product [Polarella glacialis]|uniref:PUM-HD domain-containing protein n=1 Tax=Polarella glacialis TaxID=89957 RepID=A0A813JG98_POLGL|nr:unnamed protein product [Polarella glacialis]